MPNIFITIQLLNCHHAKAVFSFDFTPYLPLVVAGIAGFVAIYNVKKNIVLQYKVKQVELIRDNASKYFTLVVNLKIIILNTLSGIKNEPDPIKKKEIMDAGYEKYITTATEVANYENLIKLQLQKNNPKHEQVGKYMEAITKELEAIRNGKSTDENKLQTELTKVREVLDSIFEEKLGKDY